MVLPPAWEANLLLRADLPLASQPLPGGVEGCPEEARDSGCFSGVPMLSSPGGHQDDSTEGISSASRLVGELSPPLVPAAGVAGEPLALPLSRTGNEASGGGVPGSEALEADLGGGGGAR